MKQVLRKFFFLTLFAAIGQMVFAYDFEVDGIYYNKLSENTVEVTFGNGFYDYGYTKSYIGAMSIPSSIVVDEIKYDVTSIGVWAFQNCRNLASITIPNGVTSIGTSAFSYCSGLTSITIPEGVTSIGESAFSGCSGLTSINIPDGVTSIEKGVFENCSSLISITIGNGVTSIENAFYNCNELTAVYISDLKAWCNIKFENESCNPLSYAHNLYVDSKIVTALTIPEGVTSIENYAFCDCSGLTSIIISEGVTSIGNYAFYNCKGLSSISIGKGITSIGYCAFYECNALKAVYISDLGTWCNINFWENNSNPLYYAQNLYVDGKLVTTLNIPDGITSIKGYAFCNCNSITSVTLPNEVTSIEAHAFYGCSGLTSITIPDGVTSIGAYAFYNCSNLTSITIPDGVTSIGASAFSDCSGLTSITIGDGVSSLDSDAFNGCSKLKIIICKSENPPSCFNIQVFEAVSKIYCTIYVPNVSVEKYKEAFGWNEFMNIVGIDMGNTDADEKCDAPTISFDNNERKLKFSCNTQGANYVYSISSDDIVSYTKTEAEVPLTGVYTITAYSTTDDKQKSETVTAKLVWVNAEIDSSTDVISAKTQRGVIVSTQNGNINISGTVDGETVNVYNAAGSLVKSFKAQGDNTVVSGLITNEVYVVKIGGTSVKVVVSE